MSPVDSTFAAIQPETCLGREPADDLGSRRKTALTAKVLREWSVTDEQIERIHAPVGLSIGADTPEEIAISVVAELIAVRRAGSRRRGGVAALTGAHGNSSSEDER